MNKADAKQGTKLPRLERVRVAQTLARIKALKAEIPTLETTLPATWEQQDSWWVLVRADKVIIGRVLCHRPDDTVETTEAVAGAAAFTYLTPEAAKAVEKVKKTTYGWCVRRKLCQAL